MTSHYLACDLGAESGRLMLGSLAAGRLTLEELHRFPNTPLQVDGSLQWDLPRLWEELKAGLRHAARRQLPLSSISTDSWGVDYVLLDREDRLMSPAFHYRDARTARGVAEVQRRLDGRTLFEETGIQFMPLNTIYQIVTEPPERLATAGRFLMIADAFNFLLGGEPRVEESNASTTQLYNPRLRRWAEPLLAQLGLPPGLFPPIVPSGTMLGALRPELAAELGLPALAVVASCSHDTGAAVAAVPAEEAGSGSNPTAPSWAYLSSGTWSLMGVELPAPLISDTSRQLNFTNEMGHGGSVRLLKNISGLWLVQECRRDWAARGEEMDYDTLTRLAAAAPPFLSLLNPSGSRFLAPGGMPARIAEYCRETGQPVPANPGAFIRCILESLALLYRVTRHQIEQLTGGPIHQLHVVGGGSKNALLNQFTADALQIPVLAGPVEATAAGNIIVQAIAQGHLSSLAAGRRVIQDSFPVNRIEPQTAAAAEWARQAARFGKLLA